MKYSLTKSIIISQYLANEESNKPWLLKQNKQIAKEFKELFGSDIEEEYFYVTNTEKPNDYKDWLDEVWEEDSLNEFYHKN